MKERGGRFLQQINPKISFSNDFLSVDGNLIIRKVGNQFTAVHCNPESCFNLDQNRIDVAVRMLNEGRCAEAVLLVTTSSWRGPNIDVGQQVFEKANFNNAELRDPEGKWSRGGEDETTPLITEVQYRGFFHDFVVDDLLKGLKEHAPDSIVLKNIKVMGMEGIIAIPDGASKPKERYLPYFIEVKTGNDPKLTPNQERVYPLICVGGHAISMDSRITQLGLVPGIPFPPLDIMLVYTSGPGQELKVFDYCASIGLRGGSK